MRRTVLSNASVELLQGVNVETYSIRQVHLHSAVGAFHTDLFSLQVLVHLVARHVQTVDEFLNQSRSVNFWNNEVTRYRPQTNLHGKSFLNASNDETRLTGYSHWSPPPLVKKESMTHLELTSTFQGMVWDSPPLVTKFSVKVKYNSSLVECWKIRSRIPH